MCERPVNEMAGDEAPDFAAEQRGAVILRGVGDAKTSQRRAGEECRERRRRHRQDWDSFHRVLRIGTNAAATTINTISALTGSTAPPAWNDTPCREMMSMSRRRPSATFVLSDTTAESRFFVRSEEH